MDTKEKNVNFIVNEKDLTWRDDSFIPNIPATQSDDNEVLLGDNEIIDDEVDDIEEYYNE